jgi:multidrug resistance efflux pump
MLRFFFAVLFFLFLVSCGKDAQKIQPARTTITESVYASVTVQPDSLYRVFAVVNGILDKILVQEGSVFRKGEPLFEIINNSPKLNADNAKLSLELARENFRGRDALLSNIRKEIEAAQLKYYNDSINFFRQKNLWEQKVGSKGEFDSKKLAFELSSNNLELLKSRYIQLKNELETQLKQAENNYKNALSSSGDFTVSAMINGKVYAVHKEQGEIVNTLEPLATVGSQDKFVIEMLVDEVDVVKISQGQQVVVSLDAYPDELFSARVRRIYPKKDERNQTFKVEALFEVNPEVLYPGLSGEGNIHISSKKEALVIPKQFLIGKDKVITDGGIVQIQTGLQTMDSIEVLSGISPETWIYLSEK